VSCLLSTFVLQKISSRDNYCIRRTVTNKFAVEFREKISCREVTRAADGGDVTDHAVRSVNSSL